MDNILVDEDWKAEQKYNNIIMDPKIPGVCGFDVEMISSLWQYSMWELNFYCQLPAGHFLPPFPRYKWRNSFAQLAKVAYASKIIFLINWNSGGISRISCVAEKAPDRLRQLSHVQF